MGDGQGSARRSFAGIGQGDDAIVAQLRAGLELEVEAVSDPGGNVLSPNFDKSAPARASIDHVSFGISPFEPDAVANDLKTRGLTVQYDIGIPGVDAVAHINDANVNYKSFHTTTTMGYNLQFSNATKKNRTVIIANP